MVKKQTNVKVVTIAVFVATFMSAVEGTIVSTAMPTIVGDLRGVAELGLLHLLADQCDRHANLWQTGRYHGPQGGLFGRALHLRAGVHVIGDVA